MGLDLSTIRAHLKRSRDFQLNQSADTHPNTSPGSFLCPGARSLSCFSRTRAACHRFTLPHRSPWIARSLSRCSRTRVACLRHTMIDRRGFHTANQRVLKRIFTSSLSFIFLSFSFFPYISIHTIYPDFLLVQFYTIQDHVLDAYISRTESPSATKLSGSSILHPLKASGPPAGGGCLPARRTGRDTGDPPP